MWLDTFNQMRKQSGMSLDELSEKSGVPKGTLTKITSGVTKGPSLETMKSLVYAMGYTLKDLDEGFDHSETLSKAEQEHIKKYRALDGHGKKMVDFVLNEETVRMEELSESEDTGLEKEPKIINIFVNPSAAGPALGETGQTCEPYELRPEDPQGAEYAVRIQGDSMEPDFPDGGIAFVNHDEMRDGDIGIFCVDGATVIKQWHYDRMLGMTYLFSLNRARADADVVLTRSNDRGMVWQGRVITRKHYPIPGKF